MPEITYGLQTVTAPAFGAGDKNRLGIALANALRELLETGAPALGWPGLNVEPVFVNRNGAGGGRDETTYTTARVRFPDDLESGVPEVLIVGIAAAGERADYDDEFWTHECVAVLDCNTNQFQPGALSDGVEAATAGALLGNLVESMLRDDELMTMHGFTNPRVSPNPPPGATDKNGLPFEFHYPITVAFEVYISKG